MPDQTFLQHGRARSEVAKAAMIPGDPWVRQKPGPQAASVAPNLKTATIDRDAQAFVSDGSRTPHAYLLYDHVMDQNDTDLLCPVCDRPMRLATVLCPAPREQTLVLQCRPCGVSTTKTVEAPGRGDSAAERRGPGQPQGYP
jgi:hypothetical protein